MKKILLKSKLNELGFTIIEMLVVMLIISIVVTLTIPNFNKILGNYQLDISAREMASDIRDLQQIAMKSQSTYTIAWNIEDEKYYLLKSVISFKTVQLPSGVDLYTTDFTNNKMILKNNGKPLNFGTVTLKCRNTGKYKYVIVDILGRVRISDTFPGAN